MLLPLLFLSRTRQCFWASRSAILPLPVRPDVTELPTQKPLLCISHASFIPLLPHLWIQTSAGPPLASTECRPNNRKRKQTGISGEEAARHRALASWEKARCIIYRRAWFFFHAENFYLKVKACAEIAFYCYLNNPRGLKPQIRNRKVTFCEMMPQNTNKTVTLDSVEVVCKCYLFKLMWF